MKLLFDESDGVERPPKLSPDRNDASQRFGAGEDDIAVPFPINCLPPPAAAEMAKAICDAELVPESLAGCSVGVKKSRKQRLSESEWLQHTAIHEAGHAVMAVHFRFPLKGVSIEADGFKAGFCKTPEAGEIMTQHPDAQFGLEKEIIILMAGTEAVKAVLPNLARAPWGDEDDREQIGVRVDELCSFTEERPDRAATRLRHMASWYMADFAIKDAVIEFSNELLRTKTIAQRRANKLIKTALETHHRKQYGVYVLGRPVGSICARESAG